MAVKAQSVSTETPADIAHRVSVMLVEKGLVFHMLSEDGTRYHYSDPLVLTPEPLWADVPEA